MDIDCTDTKAVHAHILMIPAAANDDSAETDDQRTELTS